MLKSFKTEINPTEEQKVRIRKTIGTCRFIYNFYLAHNKELHESGKKFMSSSQFRVWLNNEYLPSHPEYSWIKEAYSKSVTQAVNNGQTAFKRFFNHKSAFPKFKKKGRSDVKMYFVRNNPKDCHCERHRIKIPSLGWVRIKEKGYIPTTKDGYVIKSGHVSIKADRYYVSVLIEIPDKRIASNSGEGIGIDLGLKDFAIVSNGKTYKNINKSAKLNNKSFKMNVAPQIINGYTYVPIRAVAECFNADVGYVTEIRPKVRIVWVQDRSKTVKVSKSEAIKKATDLYFNDFLPEIRDYVLEYWHIDVNNITPSNIGEKSYFKYSGKCLADLGEYYYVEVLENAVGVLVDKYNGACYPVGGYSLGYLSISDDYGDTHWGIQWQ